MTKPKLFRFAFVFAISLSLSNCGQKSTDDTTDVKFGLLPASPYFLIHTPNHSVIEICGDVYVDWVAKAIHTWAKAINRDFKYKRGCNNPKVKIVKNSGSRCTNRIGMHAFYNTDPLVIEDCATPDYWLKQNIILHEVGHLWGLCDMYQGGVNCDFISNPGELKSDSYKSVMRYSQLSDKLLSDDIAGIKALAKKYPQ